MNDQKILLVGDDEDFLKLFGGFMRNDNYILTFTPTTKQAVEFLSHNKATDVVIIDARHDDATKLARDIRGYLRIDPLIVLILDTSFDEMLELSDLKHISFFPRYTDPGVIERDVNFRLA